MMTSLEIEYLGKHRLLCQYRNVELHVADPAGTYERRWYSANGDSFGDERASQDDIERIVYPLEFSIILKDTAGRYWSPIWKAKRYKPHPRLPGMIKYDTFSEVSWAITDIGKGRTVEVPESVALETMFLLVREDQGDARNESEWRVMAITKEELQTIYQRGLRIPLLKELSLLGECEAKTLIEEARTLAEREYSEMVADRRIP